MLSTGDCCRKKLPRFVLQEVEQRVRLAHEELLAIDSLDAWNRRRSAVEEQVLHSLGGYPERADLNARTVAVHERAGYSIENIVIESLPGLELNVNLYVPSGLESPAPAVLCPTAHSPKSEHHHQELVQGLCSMGYIALTYDCLGWGERSTGNEHFDVGSQCVMLGQNLLRYLEWDNRRALDYLLTRPEVDPERIGCTGTSGGGWTSLFHAALDPRVKSAVPVCGQFTILESVRQRYTRCPEAYLWNLLGAGFDIPDILAMVAPRPLRLILTSCDALDSLDIAATTFEAVRHIYRLYGAEDKVLLGVVDDKNSYPKAIRLEVYEWLNGSFNHKPPHAQEPPLKIEPPEVLNCGIRPSTTVQSMNADFAEKLNRDRKPLADCVPLVKSVLTLPGERPQTEILEEQVKPAHGYPHSREITVRSADDFVLHAGQVVPAEGAPSALFLSESGFDGFYTDPMPALLKQKGYAVVTADTRGYGNLKPWPSPWEHLPFCNAEWELTQGLWTLGRALVGMQVLDLQAILDAVLTPGEQIVIVAQGRRALTALHMAAIDDRVSSVACIDALSSLTDLAKAPRNKWGFSAALPGVLHHYDLPDLLASLAPRPLLILNPRGANLHLLDDEAADAVFQRVYRAYSSNLNDLTIQTNRPGDQRRAVVLQWAEDLLNRQM